MTSFETRLFRELSSMGIDVSSREVQQAITEAREHFGRMARGCCGDRFDQPRPFRERGDLDRMSAAFMRATRRGDLGKEDRITDALGDQVDWRSRRDERLFGELDRAGRDAREGELDFGSGALARWRRELDMSAGEAEEEAHGVMQKLRQALAAEQTGRDGLEGPLSGESVRELRSDAEAFARALERDGYGDEADAIFGALDRLSDRTDGENNEARI